VTFAKVLATVGPWAAQAVRHALVRAGHRVRCIVADRRMALHAGCRGRNVVGGLACGSDVAGESRSRRVTSAAIAGRRVGGIESRGRAGIPCRGAACHHAQIARRLVTGLARRYCGGYGRVPRRAQRRVVDVGGADVESASIEIRGAVAPGAVAIERSDRNVVAGCRRDRDVDKGGGDGGSVAAQAVRYALVRAGHGVRRVVTWRRVALDARGGGRNMVGRLAGTRDGRLAKVGVVV